LNMNIYGSCQRPEAKKSNKIKVAVIVFLSAHLSILPSCTDNNLSSDIKEAGMQSFGTSGKAVYPLAESKETELYSHSGKGCLTHMWFGGNWEGYGKLRIRIYVDHETEASIDMEMYMGAGIGFLDDTAPWGTSKMGKTGSPSGVYYNYHIPFGEHVRVTAQMHESRQKSPRFWYIVRGTENLPLTVDGLRLPENTRMKLYKLEDYTADTLEEFDFLNTAKTGMVYQVTVAAQSTHMNFLESMVRAYFAESDTAVLLSSGLEDYFHGTYLFNRGMYHNEEAGLTNLNKEDRTFSAYRFHERDPLFYQDGLRLTLRCGEQTDRETWKAAPTTYTTYVWTYEW